MVYGHWQVSLVFLIRSSLVLQRRRLSVIYAHFSALHNSSCKFVIDFQLHPWDKLSWLPASSGVRLNRSWVLFGGHKLRFIFNSTEIRPCYDQPATYVTTVGLPLWAAAAALQLKWKKRSERRKHCALAVVRPSQKNSPRRRPSPQGRRTAKI